MTEREEDKIKKESSRGPLRARRAAGGASGARVCAAAAARGRRGRRGGLARERSALLCGADALPDDVCVAV